MRKSSLLGMCLLVALFFVSACGPSEEQMNDLATLVASSVFATQTAVPPTSVPAPVSTFMLAADGSGDYPTLEEAVRSAPSGATIHLGPGIYRVERRLNVRKAVHLTGAGMDATEIVSEAEGYVVLFSGDGPFVVDDITFRHTGEAAASVVVVQSKDVTFSRCRFTGAVAEEFGVQAGVVRCVADYANPTKSDDEWRQRAITTVGHLLQSLDFEALLGGLHPEAGG